MQPFSKVVYLHMQYFLSAVYSVFPLSSMNRESENLSVCESVNLEICVLN